MTNITIYVEGDGDAKFLQDFIQEHYNLNLQKGKDIIKTGGWGEISNKRQALEDDKDNSRTKALLFLMQIALKMMEDLRLDCNK